MSNRDPIDEKGTLAHIISMIVTHPEMREIRLECDRCGDDIVLGTVDLEEIRRTGRTRLLCSDRVLCDDCHLDTTTFTCVGNFDRKCEICHQIIHLRDRHEQAQPGVKGMVICERCDALVDSDYHEGVYPWGFWREVRRLTQMQSRVDEEKKKKSTIGGLSMEEIATIKDSVRKDYCEQCGKTVAEQNGRAMGVYRTNRYGAFSVGNLRSLCAACARNRNKGMKMPLKKRQ